MKAYSIEWHENNLKNYKETVERERIKLTRLSEELARDEERLKFHALQIETAKSQGKTEFDSDRFMKPRVVKAR
jgi:hypothetical protein